MRLVIVDVLVVQEALAAGQCALDNVLDLFGELLFDVTLHPSEEEGSQNGLELLNDADIETLILINALTEWIRKPLFEVLLAAEDLGHKEVHQ